MLANTRPLSPSDSRGCVSFTPVNEIFMAALSPAQFGWWNERLAGDRASSPPSSTSAGPTCSPCAPPLHKPGADVDAGRIVAVFPSRGPKCEAAPDVLNDKRFLALAFDFTYGRHHAEMYDVDLRDNGMTKRRVPLVPEHHVKKHRIMGNDYYATNENTCVYRRRQHDAVRRNSSGITPSRGGTSRAIAFPSCTPKPMASAVKRPCTGCTRNGPTVLA